MELPTWLENLLKETFFNVCMIHENAKKNEKNIFCVDCCEAICHHCVVDHNSHRLLQIRRYVYHDVIRVDDVEKLLDSSLIQAYKNNKAKVMFLHSRLQTRPCRSSSNCINCDRSLQEPHLFCSISCKINQIMKTNGLMSDYLRECKVLTLPEPGSEDGLLTPDSVLEPDMSGSTGTCIDHVSTSCTATTEIVRKKRTTKYESPVAARKCHAPVEVAVNRRKSVPRRAPFH
ncbi:putative PLATZ transcription factor family protein [Tanacetum coccineum]